MTASGPPASSAVPSGAGAPGAGETIELSFVVCTRNRSGHLGETLRSYLALDDAAGWELVVVDNGSTDDTGAVLEAFRAQLPRPLTIVRVARPGLGRARNHGWQAARGAIVAFTDDDCYPARDYVSRLGECFRELDEIGFVGGRILLFDPQDQPVTIQTREQPADVRPGDFVAAGLIQGANMAFRRVALERIGGFDDRMGAGTPFPCEDVEALARATAFGFAGRYDPRPVVYHHHRRRTRAEVESLGDAYDRGRGAYYAACLMTPGLRARVARGWLGKLRGQSLLRSGRELSAAARFWVTAMNTPRRDR